MIQAKDGFPQIWIFLQHPQHSMSRRTAESHIAVLLPAVRVQGEKGKQIDGGLEYIEAVAGTDPVETAPRITALYVAPVAFALGKPSDQADTLPQTPLRLVPYSRSW